MSSAAIAHVKTDSRPGRRLRRPQMKAIRAGSLLQLGRALAPGSVMPLKVGHARSSQR